MLPIRILLIDISVFNLISSLVDIVLILVFCRTLRLYVDVKLLTIIFLVVLIFLIIFRLSILKSLKILILLWIFKSDV